MQIAEIAAEELVRCFTRAERRYRRIIPRPELRFDLRGAGAGKAYVRFNLIRLNPTLLAGGTRIDVIETAAHEAAHLIAHHVFGTGIRPHGREWRSVMRSLGRNADRTHGINTAGLVRRRRRYAYTCTCHPARQIHQLSAVRHRRVLRGGTYRCGACGSVLVPSRETLEPSGNELVQII